MLEDGLRSGTGLKVTSSLENASSLATSYSRGVGAARAKTGDATLGAVDAEETLSHAQRCSTLRIAGYRNYVPSI